MRKTLVLLLLAVALAAIPVIAGDEQAVETARGEVTSVDAGNGEFTVKPDAEGAEKMILHIDEHTKIVRDGKETGFDELSAGDRVTVNYKKDDGGRLVALSVGIG